MSVPGFLSLFPLNAQSEVLNAQQMKIYGIDVLFCIVVYAIRTMINGRICTADADFRAADFTL